MDFNHPYRRSAGRDIRSGIRYASQPSQYGHQDSSRHYLGNGQFDPAQRFNTASPVIKTEYGEHQYSPAPLPRDRAFEASNSNLSAHQPMLQDQADVIAPRVMAAAGSAGAGYFTVANTNAQECPPITVPSHTVAQPQPPNHLRQNYNFNQHNVVDHPRNPRHRVLEQDPDYFASAFTYQQHPASSAYPNQNTMAMQYEPQPFPVDYPRTMMHNPDDQEDLNRYPSPPPPMGDNPYNHQNTDPAMALNLEMHDEPLPQQKEESDAPSPGRSKPIPKPDREVTKGEDGRFVCTWPGCTEDVRSFNRKCEWSKHMDKHDRPYKCPAEGCEKLPGFTYSGGLLRHQREVHNLHGGPRKQLNCPHPNCKRYSGKGFSRQENLNEHLRRVHTDGAAEAQDVGGETEEEGSERAGMKRKRPATESQIERELAKLRKENEKLKKQAEQQNAQTMELRQQVHALQSLVGGVRVAMPLSGQFPGATGVMQQGQQQQQAPQANMTSTQSM